MNLLVVLLTLIYYISIALIHQKAIAQQPGGSGSGGGSDWKTLLANAFKANCEPIDDDEQYRGVSPQRIFQNLKFYNNPDWADSYIKLLR